MLEDRLFGTPIAEPHFSGYEIHVGETRYDEGGRALSEIVREGNEAAIRDGAVSDDGRVIGTYVHGLFDDDRFRHEFIRAARASAVLSPPESLAMVQAERDRRFDRLARHVRQSLDMDEIKRWIDIPERADAADRR